MKTTKNYWNENNFVVDKLVVNGKEVKNRIPRDFKKIIATVTSGNANGRRLAITKDDYGYHGVDDEGKAWQVLPALLRNPHMFTIESIER